MIVNDHRLRLRFATALPGEGERGRRARQQREQHVVLQRLLADLLPDLAQHLALRRIPLRLAGRDPLGLEVVHRDAVLEERREQRGVDRVAEVVGVPLLVLGHAQDAVADVAVLAEDVRVGVVHVVVRMAPLVCRAGGVPLEVLAGEVGLAGPVVLAVHHVVADLHVVEDLRDREAGDAAEPEGRQEAGHEHRAARDLEPALGPDHVADVGDVALAAVGEHALADRVELAAELVELLGREVGEGAGVGAGHWGLSWFVVRGERARGRARRRRRGPRRRSGSRRDRAMTARRCGRRGRGRPSCGRCSCGRSPSGSRARA